MEKKKDIRKNNKKQMKNSQNFILLINLIAKTLEIKSCEHEN